MTKNAKRMDLSDDRQELKRVLKMVLLLVPIPALVIFGVNIYTSNYFVAFMLLSIPIFCFISYQFVDHDKIRTGVFFLLVIVCVITTLSAIYGRGIHETAIVAYPVIVLFSSFILNAKGVFSATLIVIIGLAVVVYGEKYDYYPHRPIAPARIVDLIALTAILTSCLVVTYYLARINKNGLKKSIEELASQKQIQIEIQKNLEIKTKLLREVHHRVKNNLSLINSILDLEIISNDNEEEKKDLQALQRRIQAIARVHDPLFQSTDYQEVDIKSYLEKLIMSFCSSFAIPDNLLQLSIPSRSVSIEKAIPIGIILHEIMSALDNTKQTFFRIKITMEKINQIHVQSDSELDIPSDSLEIRLIKLMAQELQSENYELGAHSFRMEFSI